MGRIVNTTETNVVDSETGELITTEKTVVRKLESSEQFIAIFLEDVKGLMSLETPAEMKVLFMMWKDSSFNIEESGNLVAVNLNTKKIWSDRSCLAIQTINNAITSLCKKEIIIRSTRGFYILNPKYFFKGKLSERSKVIRMTLEYHIK